jgi:nucleoside-diphosphate-sugar epimerase
MQKTLLCFGIGYSAEALSDLLYKRGWSVIGTTRDAARAQKLQSKRYEIYALDSLSPEVFLRATHMLHSVPPGKDGDEVLLRYQKNIVDAPNLKWLAYLSTTGVYGNHEGAWVDETTAVKPQSRRQEMRVQTENAFLQLYKNHNVPSHVFRLAGIYGPDRSVVDDIRAGQSRRIYKQGQVFSRIHVEDIAQVLLASVDNPAPGEIYNVCDDEPAPAHEVVAYACERMNVEIPPLIPFEQAGLSDMGREFYSANRRVSNRKIQEKLAVKLLYPSYREGINALVNVNEGANSAD